jgi:NAD(P)-dependent dehydrogenase (short-subunit alcohol dehydrogenase family)
MQVEGKIALVTGASRGIGAVTARMLSRRGAAVALSARTEADMETVAAEIRAGGGRALSIVCDVTYRAQVENMVDKVVRTWERLDILVNNAGLGTPAMPVDETPPEEWDRTLDINLKSVFLCVRAAAPVMKRQHYGRIVNMSSFSGRNYSRFLGSPYAAAKAGVLGFTRQMAAELGPYGICVNAIAPNIILTGRAKAKWEAMAEEERRRVIYGIPLQRLAEPEEIATAICFLASDDASYVNGVCLDVNGGSYMV